MIRVRHLPSGVEATVSDETFASLGAGWERVDEPETAKRPRSKKTD